MHGSQNSKEDAFTNRQFDALIKLCKDIDEAYDGKITFHGHKEVSAKACPVFDYKEILGLDEKGHLKKGAVTVQKLETAGSKTIKSIQAGKSGVAVALGITGILAEAKKHIQSFSDWLGEWRGHLGAFPTN